MRSAALNGSRHIPSLALVICGAGLFFAFQFAAALLRLESGSGAMQNKFSALAKDEYLDFLIWQNVYALIAYAILTLLFALVLQPFLARVCRRFSVRARVWKIVLALSGAFLIHGFFVLRLVETRPYFLNDAKFGYWYYEILNAVPDPAKPAVFLAFFKILPAIVIIYASWWHLRRLSFKSRLFTMASLIALAATLAWQTGVFSPPGNKRTTDISRPNVIIIGSDSLRSDRLGCNGYRPRRTDGLAASGVSPRIDALAARSVNFTECYTPIASTLESGTSLMAATYPHSHGLRHMYPDEKTVAAAKAAIRPIAPLLAGKGYDTAAFGDWCAGYYELMPLGMETVSVSSFDNFKIYMSQAVVMAHFVIPLYFDHPAGYALFPQLGSFAQFVTPGVVTDRVEKRLSKVAASGQPFFWHVFYSCNHLPYRNPEPYASMFTDPGYRGRTKTESISTSTHSSGARIWRTNGKLFRKRKSARSGISTMVAPASLTTTWEASSTLWNGVVYRKTPSCS